MNVPTGESEQITGNRDILLELVDIFFGSALFTKRQSTCNDWVRRFDVEVKGAFDIRGILAWEN
jgi:hypothetical protein